MSDYSTATILPDSDEACVYRTDISGWVSRNGRFFGESEDLARYDGCTHQKCNGCGDPIPKNGWTRCTKCRNKSQSERFSSLERVVWNGQIPLCTFEGDEFFFDRDSLDDYCDEHGCRPSDLQLVLCDEQHARLIEASDFYYDILPDGQSLEEVCPELDRKFEEVNRYIKTEKPILSWCPGKVAAIVVD